MCTHQIARSDFGIETKLIVFAHAATEAMHSADTKQLQRNYNATALRIACGDIAFCIWRHVLYHVTAHSNGIMSGTNDGIST